MNRFAENCNLNKPCKPSTKTVLEELISSEPLPAAKTFLRVESQNHSCRISSAAQNMKKDLITILHFATTQNSCHLIIIFQPNVPPWTPTDHLTNSEYTGPNYKNNTRPNISSCLLATFSTAANTSNTQASQLGNYLPTTQASYPKDVYHLLPTFMLEKRRSKACQAPLNRIIRADAYFPTVITSCSHTDTGTCVSRPFSYLK
jgi:hypothetical protein